MKLSDVSSRDFVVKATVTTLLLSVVACSSTQGPVVIRESSIPEGNASSTQEKDDVSVQPVSPDHEKTTLPLVEKFIAQSYVELDNKHYEKAISLAERGLRIDRKEPRLYLVLAKAYRGEFNDKQSVYFAKQGLRYAEKTEAIYQELKKLSQ